MASPGTGGSGGSGGESGGGYNSGGRGFSSVGSGSGEWPGSSGGGSASGGDSGGERRAGADGRQATPRSRRHAHFFRGIAHKKRLELRARYEPQRTLIMGESLGRCPQRAISEAGCGPEDLAHATPHTWAPAPWATVKVRCGPSYKKRKKKAPTLSPLYDLAFVDVWTSERKIGHIGNFVSLERAGITTGWTPSGLPELLIVTFQMPLYEPPNPIWGKSTHDGVGCTIVSYYQIAPWLREELEQKKNVGACHPSVRTFLRFLESPYYAHDPARRDSAEDFSRLGALLCTATDWIFIPAHCFAIP